MRRVLRALCLITPSPRVTWPSAASTTLLSLRTHSTVVPCICCDFRAIRIRQLYPPQRGLGHELALAEQTPNCSPHQFLSFFPSLAPRSSRDALVKNSLE